MSFNFQCVLKLSTWFLLFISNRINKTIFVTENDNCFCSIGFCPTLIYHVVIQYRYTVTCIVSEVKDGRSASIPWFLSQSAYTRSEERMHYTALLLGKIIVRVNLCLVFKCYCLVMLVGVSTSCQIPKKSKPLCGTNGVSYVNLKALQCYNQEYPKNSIGMWFCLCTFIKMFLETWNQLFGWHTWVVVYDPRFQNAIFLVDIAPFVETTDSLI